MKNIILICQLNLTMKASKSIKSHIKNHEGYSSKPYYCPAGVPTIGYGSTMYQNGRKVTMLDKAITEPQATDIFDWHVSLFEKDVNMLLGIDTKGVAVDKGKYTQNQFDALVDFAYNLGSDIDADNIPEGLGDSTLLKKILANPNDPSIRTEFLKWNKAKGRVLNGLTKRRAHEAELWFKK